MIFLYFGAVQTVTYPLDHYSFNVFFIAIAAVWAVYSLIELYVIDKVSAENRNMSYFTVACIITAVSSVFFARLLRFASSDSTRTSFDFNVFIRYADIRIKGNSAERELHQKIQLKDG
jgi:hypothetical protein